MRCSRRGAERRETSSHRGTWRGRCSILISSLTLAALAIVGAISLSAPYAGAREDPPLVRLAAVTFPNLTHAERAILEFAQAGNVDLADFAQAGLSATPPSLRATIRRVRMSGVRFARFGATDPLGLRRSASGTAGCTRRHSG